MAKKKKLLEEDLIKHASEVFVSSRTWREEKISPRWRKDNNLYDGVFEPNEKKKSDVLIGQGRLFIPKTYSTVNRILVDLLDVYFFDAENIVGVKSWKNIPSETREIVKTLLNYRLNSHPIKFYEEALEACQDALRNKIGVFKVYPDLRTRKEKYIVKDPIIDPLTGGIVDFKEEEREREIEEYDPVIQCVPYEDFFIHPKATWKTYNKYPIVHRVKRSLDYLKRREYKNLDKIKGFFVSGVDDTNDEIKQQRAVEQGSPFSGTLQTDAMKEVYVYEIWSYMDMDGKGLQDSCSFVCAGDSSGPSVLLRDVEKNELPDTPNPPFVMGTAYPESHKAYGRSLPEQVEGLQKETNAIRNQRREAVALALRKPLLVSRGANIDLMKLVNRSISSVIMGDDISPSSVRELDISDPTSQSIVEQNRTDQDFYEATSIPPALMGMPSGSEETATGVTAHVSNANKKIAHVIRNLAQTLFIPAFNKLLMLEQRYCSDEYIQLVTGRVLGWNLSNDQFPASQIIQGEFELTCEVGMNKQAQVNKWLLLIERGNIANQTTMGLVQSGVMNPAQAHFVDTMKMFHKILPILGEKDIQEYMIQAQAPPPQEGGGVTKGIASQPRMAGGPIDAAQNASAGSMNPVGMEMM